MAELQARFVTERVVKTCPIVCRCPKHPLPPFLKHLISSEEQWQAALRSSRPDVQEAILECAERM